MTGTLSGTQVPRNCEIGAVLVPASMINWHAKIGLSLSISPPCQDVMNPIPGLKKCHVLACYVAT